MKKKLIPGLKEYREWAFSVSNDNSRIERTLGLLIDHECWDYNDENEPIDEDGNVLPDVTAESMELEAWVEALQFPVLAVYCFDSDFDRTGEFVICVAEFVTMRDFSASSKYL